MKRGFDFPQLMTFNIENLEISLYGDIYKKFIEKHGDTRIKSIIRRWQDFELLTNDDYEYLIDNTFIKVKNYPRVTNDFLDQMGIVLFKDGDKFDFDIAPEKVNEFASEIYDYIFINIFQEEIALIFEDTFGESNRDIGVYRSAEDDREHKINLACRSAYKFTLIDYLYNSGSKKRDFYDFFLDEFWKRTKLVKMIVDTCKTGHDIFYLPIYDHFSNYNSHNLRNLKNKLETIISSGDIRVEDKNNIIQNLMLQIFSIEDLKDPLNANIVSNLLKPILEPHLELKRATETYKTAKDLFDLGSDFNSAIDRAFYSAMYAVRALLSKKNLLRDWKAGTMSPDEKHYYIESKFSTFIRSQNQIPKSILQDFLDIKSDRWIADYDLRISSEATAKGC